MFRILTMIVALVAPLCLAKMALAEQRQEKPAPVFDAEAILRVPAIDYRKEWVQLGTFSVLSDKPAEGAKQLHVVYTARQNVDAYLRTGTFPDGAVLVKDVFAAKTEQLTTGTVSYADKIAGRFVMVKDSAGKLGSSPRFGDGWGWAFYEGDQTIQTVTADYKTACLACHEPARDHGLLYLQGYPGLRK